MPAAKTKAKQGTKRNAAPASVPAKDKPVAGVTPSPRNKQPYFRVCVMHDGTMKGFDDPAESCEFVQECDSCISSTESFPTRELMEAFLKSGTPKTPSPVKSGGYVDLNALSPDDNLKLTRFRNILKADSPQNTMAFYWKTTKRATQCVVIFRPLNAETNPMWFMKAPFHRVCIGFYAENPTDLAHVNEFFANLKLAPLRDQDKGPDAIKMTKMKNSDREFQNFVMYSTITIPVDQMTTALQEEEWIKGACHGVVNNLRSAQRTALFMECVRAAYSEKMFKSMMSQTAYGGNFSAYIQGAKIDCVRLDNLNKYIVKENANDIKMELMKTELPKKKFPGKDLYSDQLLLNIKTEPVDDTSITPPPAKKGRKTAPKKTSTAKTTKKTTAQKKAQPKKTTKPKGAAKTKKTDDPCDDEDPLDDATEKSSSDSTPAAETEHDFSIEDQEGSTGDDPDKFTTPNTRSKKKKNTDDGDSVKKSNLFDGEAASCGNEHNDHDAEGDVPVATVVEGELGPDDDPDGVNVETVESDDDGDD